MTSGVGLLSQVLNRAEFRWRLLKLLAQVSILGVLVCGLMLLLVTAVNSGWVNSRAAFLTALGLMGAGAFLGLLVILVRTVANSPYRSSLAASIERVDRRLLDRFNALLFLESWDIAGVDLPLLCGQRACMKKPAPAGTDTWLRTGIC